MRDLYIMHALFKWCGLPGKLCDGVSVRVELVVKALAIVSRKTHFLGSSWEDENTTSYSMPCSIYL